MPDIVQQKVIDVQYEGATGRCMILREDGILFKLIVPGVTQANLPKNDEILEYVSVDNIIKSVKNITTGIVYFDHSTEEATRESRREFVRLLWDQRRNYINGGKNDIAERLKKLGEVAPAFKLRMDELAKGSNLPWRYRYQEYELFICEEAYKFVLWRGSVDRIQQMILKDMKPEPEWESYKRHSSNTLNTALSLAIEYLRGGDIERIHAGMCYVANCSVGNCWINKNGDDGPHM